MMAAVGKQTQRVKETVSVAMSSKDNLSAALLNEGCKSHAGVINFIPELIMILIRQKAPSSLFFGGTWMRERFVITFSPSLGRFITEVFLTCIVHHSLKITSANAAQQPCSGVSQVQRDTLGAPAFVKQLERQR